jgi:hypothetical protein
LSLLRAIGNLSALSAGISLFAFTARHTSDAFSLAVLLVNGFVLKMMKMTVKLRAPFDDTNERQLFLPFSPPCRHPASPLWP